MENIKTLEDVLIWAEKRFKSAKLFFGHGTNNAWDEAVALGLFVLKLPPDVDNSVKNRVLTSIEKKSFMELIERRIKERIPVPYLTHQAWFCGLEFYVDERVIIPRSPMAELIQQYFQPWLQLDHFNDQSKNQAKNQTKNQTNSSLRILDLCTGSGCIAIACAKYFMFLNEHNNLPVTTKNAKVEVVVDAVDISKDALAVAEKNIKYHDCEKEVNLFQGDLFEALPVEPQRKKYDIIISNPPYVDIPEMNALPPEYRFEPRLALEAGRDGLDIVKRILKESHKFLKENGLLFVEVGNSQKALETQFPEVPFTWLYFERGGHGVFMLDKNALDKISILEK